MVFDRPKRPGQGKKPVSPTARPNQPSRRGSVDRPQRPDSRGGGSGRGSGNGGGGDRRDDGGGASPWLEHPMDLAPTPDSTASFVEYLRWMRSPDSDFKDPTKVQLLQIAEENADYRDRLAQLTKRTQLLAGKSNCFEAQCLWRIRVGGHRGPESILLPAFDALGMPYIPASTLRGVARTQAIRSLQQQQNLSWDAAEKAIEPYFGSLDPEAPENRTGHVTFFDAYPLPQASDPSGGLTVDIANNIWNWNGNSLDYKPNPNAFFSLKASTFLIGIKPRTQRCSPKTLSTVREWLIAGLQTGVGSQVNTGYGALVLPQAKETPEGFLQLAFTLEGQLIHGRQKFTGWRNGQPQRGKAEPEVRPVAFKSMLRYWFRALTRGVLPLEAVQHWEATLFGSITPQTRGWLTVRVMNGRLVQREARPNFQGKQDACGEQAGLLNLQLSSETPEHHNDNAIALLKNLTWLMFHLGGIGQGARRPCYSRKTRERAPWWRGSTLIPESDDPFWKLPEDMQTFAGRFQQRLGAFFEALGALAEQRVNWRAPQAIGQVRGDRWVEAVDANCRIILCHGAENQAKPYALAVLHSPELKYRGDYDGNLCGQVRRGVKPSPVWIIDLGDYQVATIFGANQDPRRRYIRELRDRTSGGNYIQLWPVRQR
jgi:CRISPR-associated protein Cmr6